MWTPRRTGATRAASTSRTASAGEQTATGKQHHALKLNMVRITPVQLNTCTVYLKVDLHCYFVLSPLFIGTAGDDDFISIYGCVDSISSPSDGGSWVPDALNVQDLKTASFPDEVDECEDEDDIDLPLAIIGLNPDSEINGKWCLCEDDECNGARASKASFVGVVSFTAALQSLFFGKGINS